MVSPLEGVKVVELGGWMAAPGAAAMLADMGADVVKGEPLGGDPMRFNTRQPAVPEGAPPLDASFQMDNRGKRGVAIAVNKPEGADLMRRLTSQADVFVNNMLPARQAKYGLDAPTLHALNSRLVHATLTGYGITGPDASRPGYDITAFFGRGGIIHTSTEPDGWAPRMRPAQGDHTASLALLSSVLAALRLVERTGEGQVVEVSLLATAAWSMSTDLSATLVDGQNPVATGRRGRPHALHGSFRCADGRWILLFMPEAHWWPRFCEAVGRGEWIEDPRFHSIPSRAQYMIELTALMDELFSERTLDEWSVLFDQHGFIWGPGSTIAEFAKDRQAEAIGLFPTITHPSNGTFRTVASPVRVAGADVAPRGPAPGIGEHTAEVLTGLGIDSGQLQELVDAGVVGAGAATS